MESKVSHHNCHGVVILWLYSLVHGFLDRQDAHDMLQECAPGTFLIRFSQSQAGLSVAFKKCIYQSVCVCCVRACVCMCVCVCVHM